MEINSIDEMKKMVAGGYEPTQAEIAKILGIKRQSVNHWYVGRWSPSRKNRKALSIIFGGIPDDYRSNDGKNILSGLLQAEKLGRKKHKCIWIEDRNGQWLGQCGFPFEFYSGGPKDNGFNGCPKCMKPIEEIRHG